MTKPCAIRFKFANGLASVAISPAFAGERHRRDSSDRSQRNDGLVEQSPSTTAAGSRGDLDPFPVYGVNQYSPVIDK